MFNFSLSLFKTPMVIKLSLLQHFCIAIFIEFAPTEAFDLMPGHAYFLEKDKVNLKSKLQNELRPLLEEYLVQGYVAGFTDEIRAYLQWIDVE